MELIGTAMMKYLIRIIMIIKVMMECHDSQQEFLPNLFRDHLNPEGVG